MSSWILLYIFVFAFPDPDRHNIDGVGGAEGAQRADDSHHGGGARPGDDIHVQQLLDQLANTQGFHRRGQRLRGTVELGLALRLLPTHVRSPR